jgi:hypothetical protein
MKGKKNQNYKFDKIWSKIAFIPKQNERGYKNQKRERVMGERNCN